jgi:hypothetical protein
MSPQTDLIFLISGYLVNELLSFSQIRYLHEYTIVYIYFTHKEGIIPSAFAQGRGTESPNMAGTLFPKALNL